MKVIRKILGIVTYSCMTITEMAETKETTKLSFSEKIKYKMHLAFCKTCRSYEKQSTLIGQALSQLMPSTQKKQELMDDTAKKRILDKIKQNEN